MKWLYSAALIAGLGLTSGAMGSQLVKERCADCHGMEGASLESDVPTISGTSEVFFTEAMFGFADKVRPCTKSKFRAGDKSRPEVDMCEVAKNMTEAEINEVAAWYTGHPFVAAKQPFDAAKAAIGKQVHMDNCEKCHADGGQSVKEDAGRLAGQWMPYLRKSFDEYQQEKRWMPEKMQVKWTKLNAEERDALLHFYASQQ